MAHPRPPLDGPTAADIAAMIRHLVHDYPDNVLEQVSLHDLTTFRIGGPAAGVCRVKTPAEALEFQAFAAQQNLPLYISGCMPRVNGYSPGFPTSLS